MIYQQPNGTEHPLEIHERLPSWYYISRYGIYEKYNDIISLVLYNLIQSNDVPVVRIMLGPKVTYDIDLTDKVQINTLTKTQRSIFSEEDMKRIAECKNFPLNLIYPL